ncbi:MAG: TusE/DsrC/DsvC family sulfur relay protein [Deltaproteobacteria bacterium]|jgi:tRNA 2-thiouridine synthesizing protein E|nr:TusE/DsrC/DsvC family sulfur relay protein [Deltaproteobacteria bacterium]
MPTVEHNGKVFPVTDDGFLTDSALWCPEWVDHVRDLEELDEVTEDHRELMIILRDHHEKHGHPPKVKEMTKHTGFKLKHIYELFPSGPGKGACKMAGLPKPDGCV